jgi:hypothetical protein
MEEQRREQRRGHRREQLHLHRAKWLVDSSLEMKLISYVIWG